MTSRPPLGVQQRQPQRSLSGGLALSQRPAAQQRSLSQQCLPPSSVRRETTFADAAAASSSPGDAGDASARHAAQNMARYGANQRLRGSRLKLELSHDMSDGITSAGIGDWPAGLTSSSSLDPFRLMSQTDTFDAADNGSRPQARQHVMEGDGPLPMPQRPPRFAPAPSRSQIRPQPGHPPQPTPKKEKDRDTKPPPPKPYLIEIPPDAPHYPIPSQNEGQARNRTSSSLNSSNRNGLGAKGHLDFGPWTGDHPEDRLNESVLRHGFLAYSKLPNGLQNETATAKQLVQAPLKHKSGFTFLSNVFTSILGQRRQRGLITAPSTFKPPPRVTLTEPRREGWLQDLASPATPLRRLSRTIPHGIRGKTLLDQCLTKKIPADRAVWLAKCVGANEIRGLRRMGASGGFIMGGEVKWIRDWTICVEQFIDNVVCSFSEADWKSKVNYA